MRLFTLFLLSLSILLCDAITTNAHAGNTIIRDTEIETYLRNWTKGVFNAAGLSPEQVNIVLVQDTDVNAFVAGGTNIFIYTGLIAKTKTPEELIGVIAHETGHIAGGHLVRTRRAMENASFESILGTVLGVGAAIAGAGADAATAGVAIGQASATNSFLSHSRVQESSADQAGLKYMMSAALDPSGLISFLKVIANQELLPTSQQSGYMRTHPLSRDRIEALDHTLATYHDLKTSAHPTWTEGHARLKAKLQAFISPSQITYAYPSSNQSIAARYARAIAAYRMNKIDEAINGMNDLIKAEPQNPYFYELKGQILYESGKAKESIPVYQKSLSLLPSAALVRTAYAQSLIDTGNYQTALSELKRAEKDEPREAHIKHLMATAAGRLGNEPEAKVYLAEEAAMTGRDKDARDLANAALKTLPAGSPARIRAQDLLTGDDHPEKDD